MDWKDRIEINPEVLVGKPVVKGTRLAVEFVPTPDQGGHPCVRGLRGRDRALRRRVSLERLIDEDTHILAQAREQERTIATLDKDFGALAFLEGIAGDAGVVLLFPGQVRSGRT